MTGMVPSTASKTPVGHTSTQRLQDVQRDSLISSIKTVFPWLVRNGICCESKCIDAGNHLPILLGIRTRGKINALM